MEAIRYNITVWAEDDIATIEEIYFPSYHLFVNNEACFLASDKQAKQRLKRAMNSTSFNARCEKSVERLFDALVEKDKVFPKVKNLLKRKKGKKK